MATDHKSRAADVRAQIESGAGVTDAELRRQVAGRAAGGPAIGQPYDALAAEIGEAAYRVTDAQVSAVRSAVGSDKAAFEIVMSAAVGAGLLRFDRAMQALNEASDAAR